MILLKEFYRKTSTKLYIFILSILICIVFILFGFIDYYVKLSNEIFSDNTVILVESKNNYYNNLLQIPNIYNVKEILGLKPDYSDSFIVSRDFISSTDNKDLHTTEVNLNWEDLLISDFSKIILKKDNSGILKNNEMSIGLNDYFLNWKQESLKKLSDKEIGFYFEEAPIKFLLKEVHESKWPEIIISESKYNELKKSSSLFLYQTEINDYRNSYEVKSKILNIDRRDIHVTMESSYMQSDGASLYALDDLVNVLKIVSYVLIIIFFILYYFIIKNIFRDFSKEAQLNEESGYKARDLKVIALNNMFTLNTLAIIIAILLQTIISLTLKNHFNIDIGYAKYLTIFLIYSIMLIISFVLSFTSKFLINQR